MIEFTLEDGMWCPLAFCEHCGEPIRKAIEGNVEYRPSEPSPCFVHKRCMQAFEFAHIRRGTHPWFCEELGTFVLRLAINLDMAENEGQDGMFTKIAVRGKLVAGV